MTFDPRRDCAHCYVEPGPLKAAGGNASGDYGHRRRCFNCFDLVCRPCHEKSDATHYGYYEGHEADLAKIAAWKERR